MRVHIVATTLRTLPRVAYVLGATLGTLSLLSWLFVARSTMSMAGVVDFSALSLFTTIWGVGMVAMMLPSLIPMVYTVTISALKRLEDDRGMRRFQQRVVFLPASLFVLSYVAVWTIVGAVFYLAITALAQAGFL